MIKELKVSNYRSIGQEVLMPLGRLSIMVGPNGSGKSNLLDVLSFIRDAVLQGLPAAVIHRGGINAVRRHSRGRPYDIHIEITIENEDITGCYGFVVTGDRAEDYRVKSEWASCEELVGEEGSFKRNYQNIVNLEGAAPRIDPQSLVLTRLGGDERFKPLVDYLSSMRVYSIFPDTLRAPQKFDIERPMKSHGENWVSVLKELGETERQELKSGLLKLTGDIEDVRVTSAAGYLVPEFKLKADSTKDKKWFEAARQSDGTLRVAGLITALVQQPPLTLVGIEEPELTVHPGALPMLYDYMKQASEVSQVIFTTHSPIILDVVDVDTDLLFSVDRTDGVTSVRQLTDEQL
jgi:predicted ATPase